VATTADLLAYAEYLKTLRSEVQSAMARGLSEDQAVQAIDLGTHGRKILPSFHDGKVSWATAESNVRCVYRLLLAEKARPGDVEGGKVVREQIKAVTNAEEARVTQEQDNASSSIEGQP
jgi:hypothetical protein